MYQKCFFVKPLLRLEEARARHAPSTRLAKHVPAWKLALGDDGDSSEGGEARDCEARDRTPVSAHRGSSGGPEGAQRAARGAPEGAPPVRAPASVLSAPSVRPGPPMSKAVTESVLDRSSDEPPSSHQSLSSETIRRQYGTLRQTLKQVSAWGFVERAS